MKSPDIELYAQVFPTELGWDLFIGRDVTGNQSHGAACWVGTFDSSVDAIRYAQRRGVYSSRIAVDVPQFRTVRTVDGGTVLKRVS